MRTRDGAAGGRWRTPTPEVQVSSDAGEAGGEREIPMGPHGLDTIGLRKPPMTLLLPLFALPPSPLSSVPPPLPLSPPILARPCYTCLSHPCPLGATSLQLVYVACTHIFLFCGVPPRCCIISRTPSLPCLRPVCLTIEVCLPCTPHISYCHHPHSPPPHGPLTHPFPSPIAHFPLPERVHTFIILSPICLSETDVLGVSWSC